MLEVLACKSVWSFRSSRSISPAPLRGWSFGEYGESSFLSKLFQAVVAIWAVDARGFMPGFEVHV